MVKQRKNHTLEIKYTNNVPAENAMGLFSPGILKSKIHIEKNSEQIDTLIHELSHAIIYLLTGKYYRHGKKFNKVYNFLKEL